MCQDNNYAPQLLSQEYLNYLVRDFALSKEKVELLKNSIQQDANKKYSKRKIQTVCVIYFRRHSHDLASFCTVQGPLCHCHDIHELFQALSQKYKPDEWRLFIHASKTSLKAVLLYKGIVKPHIPIGHCVHLRETYDNMNALPFK